MLIFLSYRKFPRWDAYSFLPEKAILVWAALSYQARLACKLCCFISSIHSLWTWFWTSAWALPNRAICIHWYLWSKAQLTAVQKRNSLLNLSFLQHGFSFPIIILNLWRTTNVGTQFSKLNPSTACNNSTSRKHSTAKALRSLWFAAWIQLMDTHETVPRITLIMHCKNRVWRNSSPISQLPKENQPLKTFIHGI